MSSVVEISFPSEDDTERSFIVCGERPKLVVRIRVKDAGERMSNYMAIIDSITIKPMKQHPLYQLTNRMRSVESLLSDTASLSRMSSTLSSPARRDVALTPTDIQQSQLNAQDAFLIDESTLGIQFNPLIDSDLEFSEASVTLKVTVYERTPIDLLSSKFIREPRLGDLIPQEGGRGKRSNRTPDRGLEDGGEEHRS